MFDIEDQQATSAPGALSTDLGSIEGPATEDYDVAPPAGEAPLPGVTGENLAAAIRQHGHHAVHYGGSLNDTLVALRRDVRPGDLVITLGAGSVWQVGVDLPAVEEGDDA